MAKMVTRTIITTEATVLGLNIDTATPEQHTFILGGKLNAKDALKLTVKLCEGNPFKPVSVISTKTSEVLYGMTEDEFIQFGRILPPRKVYSE